MKLSLKILIHSIFWMVFTMFTTMFGKTEKTGVWPSLDMVSPHIIINIIWAAVIFYLFYFYFFRFFEQKRYVTYLIYSIIWSIVVSFLFLPIHKFIFPRFEIFNYLFFLPPIFGSFIIAQCGCLIKGFENWFTTVQIKTELENKNLRNELDLLKSQINPHFLFNTLNNIDALINTSPKGASDSLITLADMLRYMVYDTKPDQVPLNKEIEYISNYIKLQNLRFHNSGYIKILLPDDCGTLIIAPMLIIPFIENAFKYSFDKGDLPVIEASIRCDYGIFKFICKNYFDVAQVYQRTGGVGIENVKRRLELLYPNKHNLNILKENGTFKVELQIQLV